MEAAKWRPKQIISGSSNRNPRCFDTGRLGRSDLVAYVSGCTVVVATRALHVLQQIDVPLARAADALSLTWSPRGRLALASRSGVYVYHASQSVDDADLSSGSLELLLFVSSGGEDLTACCWKQQEDALLVASATSLRLFDLSRVRATQAQAAVASLRWTLPVVTAPFHIAFSPDDAYLALCGEHDRVVKVLYTPTAAETSGDPYHGGPYVDLSGAPSVANTDQKPPSHFTYLPHPRGVHSLSWREMPVFQFADVAKPSHVLLTQARDDVTRIWMEIQRAEDAPVSRHCAQFAIANIIDAAPGTVVSWLRVRDAARTSTLEEKARQSALSEDWIVGVEPDGTVVVWGVLNLSNTHKNSQRFPTVFIWNRLAPLPAHEGRPLKIACLGHATVLDEHRGPSHLNLYTATRKGGISAWRYSLRTPGRIVRVLMGTIWGHKGQVRATVASQHAPLLLTIDSFGHGVVWESAATTMADPSMVLLEVVELKALTAACWLPGSSALEATLVCCGQAEGAGTLVEALRFTRTTLREPWVRAAEPLSKVTLAEPRESFVKLVVLPGVASKSAPSQAPTLLAGLSPDGHITFLHGSFHKHLADLAPLVVPAAREMRLTTLSPVRPLFDEALPYHLLTGSSTGQVLFWSTSFSALRGIEVVVEGTVDVDAVQHRPIELLSAAYHGRFATSVLGAAEVCIWELESCAPSVALEFRVSKTIKLKKQTPKQAEAEEEQQQQQHTVPVTFDWLPSGDGHHVLAIGSGKTVRLVLETGSGDAASFALRWSDGAAFSRLNSPCTNVAFVGDGSLVVGTEKEIVVFTKWWHDHHEWSIFRASDLVHSALPLYHPKMLLEFIMGGHFDVVKLVLRSVLLHMNAGATGFVHVLSLEDVLRLTANKKRKMQPSIQPADRPVPPPSAMDAAPTSGNAAPADADVFGPADAVRLSERLALASLPGLSRKDQLRLLAVVDTLRQILELGAGLDAPGTRFFVSLKMFQFLRKVQIRTAFSMSNWAWALQSQAHETLLSHVAPTGAFTWTDVRQYGVPMWLKNPERFRQVMENVAKTAYAASKDPFDCLLLYVALKRTGVLSTMFKMAKKEKVAQFLLNDFTDERWQTAAMKNAYSLIKQRLFNQAAAFFLVAGKLRDCLKILLKHEDDFLLALSVARLVEGVAGTEYRWVLEEHVVPRARELHSPWLLSMSKWLMSDFAGSLQALLQTSDRANAAVAGQRYGLLGEGSDLDPVIMYYAEHLLTSTAEMVKYGNLDRTADVRLRRKTVFATFNSGCLHHALERLINVPVFEDAAAAAAAPAPTVALVAAPAAEAAPAPVTSFKMSLMPPKRSSLMPPPKKAPAAAAPAPSILEAFDDGFSHLPTPDWAKPAEQQQQQQNQQQAGGQPVESDQLLSLDTRQYETDASMRIKVALAYLIALDARLAEECHSSVDGWLRAARLVTDTAQLLCDKLKIDVAPLLDLVRSYARQRHLCRLDFCVLPSSADRPALFEIYASDMLLAIEGSLNNDSPDRSVVQARRMSEVAAVMHECLTEAARQEGRSLCTPRIGLAVLLGLFFSAWIERNYASLAAVLQTSPGEGSAFAVTAPVTATASGKAGASASEGDNESDDERKALAEAARPPAAVEQFMGELVELLVFSVVLRRLCASASEQKADAESLPPLDKLVAKLVADDSSGRLAILVALLQHYGDLLEALRAHYSAVQALLSGTLSLSAGQGVTPSRAVLEQWRSLVHSTERYRSSSAYAALCAVVLVPSVFDDVTRAAGIEFGSAAMLAAATGASAGSALHRGTLDAAASFGTPVVLVGEEELLHAFCVPPGENPTMVVCTARGQAQMSFDAMLAAQQSFAARNEQSVAPSDPFSPPQRSALASGVRKSPMRANAPSPAGPPLPPSSFLGAQSDMTVALAAHPSMPFYLATNVAGAVQLFQYGFPEVLTLYRASPAPRATAVRFGPSGSRFGAVDEAGTLSLWQFDSNVASHVPFAVLPCHSKRASDLCFLETGNIVATAGLSKGSSANVCIWDTLMAPAKACVATFEGHHKGATRLAYRASSYTLYSGGKSGELCAWDVRQRKLLTLVADAHEMNVRALAVDEDSGLLVSGSTDGSIKLWSAEPELTLRHTWVDAHKTHTITKGQNRFLTSPVSTFGVMEVAFWNHSILSCGADGRLVLRRCK